MNYELNPLRVCGVTFDAYCTRQGLKAIPCRLLPVVRHHFGLKHQKKFLILLNINLQKKKVKHNSNCLKYTMVKVEFVGKIMG